MKALIALVLFSILFGINTLNAQDKIIKTNKEIILCKVLKIGDKVIQYTQAINNTETTYSILKDSVSRIDFEKGKSLNLTSFDRVLENYELQRKNIFKFEFFSPLSGNLSFAYEHSLEKQRSVEMSIGFIGVGSQIFNDNARGAFIKIGYKIMRSPEIYHNANQYSHILKGFYVRPDFIFSYYSFDKKINLNSSPGIITNKTVSSENYSGAFIINIGKQWIIDDAYSFSWYGGVGYAFSTDEGYYYSHFAPFGNDVPIALSCGINMGLLF